MCFLPIVAVARDYTLLVFAATAVVELASSHYYPSFAGHSFSLKQVRKLVS